MGASHRASPSTPPFQLPPFHFWISPLYLPATPPGRLLFSRRGKPHRKGNEDEKFRFGPVSYDVENYGRDQPCEEIYLSNDPDATVGANRSSEMRQRKTECL